MSGDNCVTYKVGDFDVQENGIVRDLDGFLIGRLSDLKELRKKVSDLKDFAIWMTGCGYDFCQHQHFIEKRDELLKE